MKKLSKTKAELKKALVMKKACNWTWLLIKNKKNENSKKYQASKFVSKITKVLPKFHPKLITKILLFLLFKLVSSFNREFKRICVRTRNFSSKNGRLFGLGAQLSLGAQSAYQKQFQYKIRI